MSWPWRSFGAVAGQRHAPAFVKRWEGERRRRAGHYQEATVQLFRDAWTRSPTPRNYLGYLCVRRDLGQLPTRDEAESLIGLSTRLPHRLCRRALNLAAEVGLDDTIASSVSRSTLERIAPTSPAIAGVIRSAGFRQDDKTALLADMYEQRDAWRSKLTQLLASNGGDIVVVGNAATLVGSNLGTRIDEYGLVVRFNQFASSTSRVGDTGKKTDVWVRAPNVTMTPLRCPAVVVLSGADPLYRLSDWSSIVPMLKQGVEVVTIPLAVWTQLVASLSAPPSAGVLFLHWATQVLGQPRQLAAAGFAAEEAKNAQQYHHALPRHRPSHRHNWTEELRLLQLWRAQGMKLLSRDSP